MTSHAGGAYNIDNHTETDDGQSMQSSDLVNDGWALARAAINTDAVAAAKLWIQCNLGQQPNLTEMQAQFDAPGDVRKLRRIYWADPPFWSRWIHRAGMSRLAADLVGPDAALVFHAAFLKPAKVGGAVGYHQDQALWEAELPHAWSFWTPLERADATNGSIVVCPRSHLVGLIKHRPDPAHPWHDVVDPAVEGLTPLPVEADPGDVVIWDRHLVHGSAPNESRRSRWAIVFVFVRDGSGVGSRTRDMVLLTEIERLAEEGSAEIGPTP